MTTVHLHRIALKGVRAPVPATEVHTEDHLPLGYALRDTGGSWAALAASGGPQFPTRYDLHTRKAAIAHILAVTTK